MVHKLTLIPHSLDRIMKKFMLFQCVPYVALIGVVSACLVSTGPGRFSLDAALGWHLAGPGWAGRAIVVGVAAAGGHYVTATRGPVPADIAAADIAAAADVEVQG